jgi:ABC-2 type transport system ATP-binding protein
MIRIEGLTKRFPVRRRLREVARNPWQGRTTDALRDFSCTVARGEFFGLLGPNGAGKSTLFRLLATLITPDGGVATVDGHDIVRDADRVRATVGFVSPEERSLNWRLSAGENLRFYGALYRLPATTLETRIAEVLAAVDLADAGNRLVGAFSSGMRQRLLIARALLPSPRVLLLDEPTRSLDPVAARQFRQFLRSELVDRRGCTVMLATHNTEEAMTLCDRVAVLHRGQLLALDRAGTLAHAVLGARYQVRTTSPDHEGFSALERRQLIADRTQRTESDGVVAVELSLRVDEARSGEILAALVHAGVDVLEFQRQRPPLADVIHGLVQRQDAERHTPTRP